MLKKRERKLEVRAFRRRQHAGYGYVGYEWVDVQQLGYKTMFGFKVLDEEIVPNDVGIAIGALGSYIGPWRSKFIDHIPAERGGNVGRKTASVAPVESELLSPV